jgi:hypothetical protein
MPGYSADEERAVTIACDPVQDHSDDQKQRLVCRKAAQQRRDRSPLTTRIDGQHDRPAGDEGELCGGTGLTLGAGPVEQSHGAFAEHDVGIGFELGDEPGERRWPHTPDIEVERRPAYGGGMKGRINEIGTRLCRGDPQPPLEQIACQPGGHQGFAMAGGRGGQDQTARAHGGLPTQSSAARSRTTSPITIIAGA